jgi:hypothetical protein
MTATKEKKAEPKKATTATSTTKAADKPKAVEEHKKAPASPVSSPVPPGLNDRREDGAPVLGHFVEITKGDDKGFFGVFVEAEGENAVVRSRSDAGVRKVAPIADLVASDVNRR